MSIGTGILAGLATGGISNLMSEWHADKQMSREKELMNYQNQLNKANALDAYRTSVQGMKMAGLNPALAQDAKPLAPEVSKGSVSQAENVELDPTIMLLDAQRRNIEADTAKKEAEVPNVQADTSKKIAERLYTNAGTDKVKSETQNINNINDTYAATNRSLADFGKGMAEKWQATDWYNHLAPDTKSTIDAIAAGEIPLSVGAMHALRDVISAQKELSDADRTLVKNAFDNAVTDAMFSEKSIMDSIARMPETQQKHLNASKDKIIAETEKIKYKFKDLIDAELKGKKLSNTQLDALIKSFKTNDLGYLKSQGEYGKWLEAYSEEMLQRLLPLVTGGAAAQRYLAPQSKSMIDKPGDPGYKQTMQEINKGSFRPFGSDPSRTIVTPYEQGVHSFFGRTQRTQSRYDD